MSTCRISELAGRTGVPATTLRYYEKERLLPADRTPAGYRVYTDADADRVQIIDAANHLGTARVWDGACVGRSATNSTRPVAVSGLRPECASGNFRLRP